LIKNKKKLISEKNNQSEDQTPQNKIETKKFSTKEFKVKTDDILTSEGRSDEIAQQLTLIEYNQLKNIKPYECSNKLDDPIKAPSFYKLSQFFNELSNWILACILNEIDIKKRAKILELFIEIAMKCVEYHNFNTSYCFMASLNNIAIDRLKITWELVSKDSKKSLNKLNKLFDLNNSFKNYREKISISSLPAMPMILVLSNDLTKEKEGNFSDSHLLNFTKYRLIYREIKDIQKYQSWPYNYELNLDIFFVL